MRARESIVVTILLAAVVAVSASVSAASGASSTTVVSATVPSAILFTNNCTQAAGRELGAVFPNSTVTTATALGSVCSFGFQSSNDSAMVRLGQRDGIGSAMDMSNPAWAQTGYSDNSIQEVTAYNASFMLSVGRTGRIRNTFDGGQTWNEWSGIGGGAWHEGVQPVPGDPSTWWVIADSAKVHRVTNANTLTPTFTDMTAPMQTALTAAGLSTTSNISDVAVINANTILVTGESGWIAKSTTAGTSWSAFQIPGVSTIAGIDWVDSNTMYAVGSHLLRTTLGGDNAGEWSTMAKPAGAFDWTDDVDVADATHIYAIGQGGTIWTSNGVTWTNRSIKSRTVNDMNDVATSAATPLVAYAVTGSATLYRTDDFGATWTLQPTRAAGELRGITQGPASTTVVAVGDQRLSVRSTDGIAFAQTYMTPGEYSHGAIATDPTDGRVAVATAQGGIIRRSTDGGSTWTNATTGATNTLFGIDLVGSGTGWAVGDQGTILKTTNNGLDWTSTTSPVPGVRLWTVDAIDPHTAVASGENGTVIRTTNGGTSWTIVPTGTTNLLRGISASSATSWIAVGADDTIRFTTNAGVTWSSPTGKPGVGSFFQVTTPSANVAWISLDDTDVWKTTDGGANWVAQPIPGASWSAQDIDAVDDRIVYATAGGPRLARSTDGGTTWSQVSVPATGNTFFSGVAAVDANTAIGVGTLNTVAATGPSGAINALVSNYANGPADWDSGGASSMFGVCLQAVSAGTTGVWTVDSTPFAPNAQCTASDGDPWNAVPAAMTKIASTATPGTAGRVDLVWGFRPKATQLPGVYTATVVVEALAPNT